MMLCKQKSEQKYYKYIKMLREILAYLEERTNDICKKNGFESKSDDDKQGFMSSGIVLFCSCV